MGALGKELRKWLILYVYRFEAVVLELTSCFGENTVSEKCS